MRKIFAMILVLAMVCSGVGYAEENEILNDEEIVEGILDTSILSDNGIFYTEFDEENYGYVLEAYEGLPDGHYVIMYLQEDVAMLIAYDKINGSCHSFLTVSKPNTDNMGALIAIFDIFAKSSSEDTYLVIINGEDTYIDENTAENREMADKALLVFATLLVM